MAHMRARLSSCPAAIYGQASACYGHGVIAAQVAHQRRHFLYPHKALCRLVCQQHIIDHCLLCAQTKQSESMHVHAVHSMPMVHSVNVRDGYAPPTARPESHRMHVTCKITLPLGLSIERMYL